MKKKRIVVASIVLLVLLIGAVSIWRYFTAADDDFSVNDNWKFVSVFSNGALSKEGYYFVNDNLLSFGDIQKGGSINLCTTALCNHENEDCSAYLGIADNEKMFFWNDHLYYIESNMGALTLYRRDAAGMSLLKVSTLGMSYTKEQKSLEVGSFVHVDKYLYYILDIKESIYDEENGTNVIRTVMTSLCRLDLSTGREEILFELELKYRETQLKLCAAGKAGALFTYREGLDMDYNDPNYSVALNDVPMTLKKWDAETGKISTVFEKTTLEFESVSAVWNNKVYYKTRTAQNTVNPGYTYSYDLATGKEEQVTNGSLRYLGGGYAHVAIPYTSEAFYLNLRTNQTIPYAVEKAQNMPNTVLSISDTGCVLEWAGEIKKEKPEDNFGYVTNYYSYISFESLADGMQEKDLVTLYSYERFSVEAGSGTSTTVPTDPTDPTEPSSGNSVQDIIKNPILFAAKPPLPESQANKKIQHLPENVENPDDLPVLKWVCLMDDYSHYNWTENAVIDLNRMLADKNIPFRVQFVMLSYSRLMGLEASKIQEKYDIYLDWFATEDAQKALQDADLVYANMTPSERKQYLMPITEYVTGNTATVLKDMVAHELNWLDTSADGEIYGFRGGRFTGQTSGSAGWIVDAEFMKAQGLTIEDFAGDIWEMDELFAKLYKANGEKPFLYFDNSFSFNEVGFYHMSLCNTYQRIGACFAINHGEEIPKVVNILEADTAIHLRNAAARYRKAGYMLSDDTQNYDAIKICYETVFGNTVYTSQDNRVCIPVTPAGYDILAYSQSVTVGIAATSAHQTEALALLELIVQDEKIRNQLLFGTAGQDYSITENGINRIEEIEQMTFVDKQGNITITKRYDEVTGYQMDFLSPLNEFSVLKNPNAEEELRDLREQLDGTTYVHYPITFDYYGFESELETIGTILIRYKDEKLGALSADEYDQMLQELKTAGSDEITAELQRQLDEWLAANPDWDK